MSSLSGTLEALNNGNVFVGVGVGDDVTVWVAFSTGATISISSLSTNSNILINKGGSVAFTEGDITIADQMKGSISITADYKGDIAIEGDDGLESGAEIDISADLALSGSVSINHELAGLLEAHDDLVGYVLVGTSADLSLFI